MSTLKVSNLKHTDSVTDNIVLNSNGTIGGSCLASTTEVNGTHTTGTVTSGTASLTVASATGIVAGMYIVGEGIAPGTTVSSIVGTTVTMSANAAATLSSDPVSFYIHNKILTPSLVAGQLCRAWVNFNGTGTVAIRASYNVSSITDNGTGNYNINMTTALADANYCVAMSCWTTNSSIYVMGGQLNGFTNTSSAFRVTCSNSAAIGSDNSSGFTDVANIFVSVFR
jgi:hypothetical protein